MPGRTPRTVFECPLCDHRKLTTDGMREHIKAKHYLADFELFDGVVRVEIVGSDGKTITAGLEVRQNGDRGGEA